MPNNTSNNQTIQNFNLKIKDKKILNLLKTSVNISNNKKEKEKTINDKEKIVTEIKTPNNIFKTKLWQ